MMENVNIYILKYFNRLQSKSLGQILRVLWCYKWQEPTKDGSCHLYKLVTYISRECSQNGEKNGEDKNNNFPMSLQ